MKVYLLKGSVNDGVILVVWGPPGETKMQLAGQLQECELERDFNSK